MTDFNTEDTGKTEKAFELLSRNPAEPERVFSSQFCELCALRVEILFAVPTESQVPIESLGRRGFLGLFQSLL